LPSLSIHFDFDSAYIYILLLFHLFLFFNISFTTYIYTLSLHDALPIFFVNSERDVSRFVGNLAAEEILEEKEAKLIRAALNLASDRKSTRLNSSHRTISYAVFCLKKKKKKYKYVSL